MKFFAHRTRGGIRTTFTRIEVKNQEIRFGKIHSSFLQDMMTAGYSSGSGLIASFIFSLIYDYYLKPSYRKKLKKLNTLEKTADFTKARGNFVIKIDDLERIHYNSPVNFDFYFILKNGDKYNYISDLEEAPKILEYFKEIPLTTHDYTKK